MRYALVALSFLFGACSYKSVTLHIPSPQLNSNTTIALTQPVTPIVGYIEKEHVPIKIASDLGSYIRAKLAGYQGFRGYRVEIAIDRVGIVYEPKKSGKNLYGVVAVQVRLLKEGKLIQKRIVVKGIDSLHGFGYERGLERFLQRLLDAVVKEIEGLV